MSKIRKSIISMVVISLTVLLGIGLLAGCSAAGDNTTSNPATKASDAENQSGKKFTNETLVLTGSTTLLEVAQKWAEAFMNANGGQITVNGGGSGEGIAALLNKTTDLANASRSMKDEELTAATEKGIEIKENIVLFDGICVITSKNIDVKELSIDQLADIFMGKITNWQEVGGPDAAIVAAARDSNSGTGEYFLERVIQRNKTEEGNDYSELCLRLQSNSDVANQVSENENSIGYIGIGYIESTVDNANLVAVKDGNSAAITPSTETVADKSYPISRDLYIYEDLNSKTEISASFMEFVLSAEGQALGAEAGFVGVK
ncbi:MAG: PstS family phosphate ABC transporter substrate-binding protein [Candidatus Humimicrobiaceae bacterium]